MAQTIAVIPCGDVVCDKCMWRQDNWCEIYDAYPEQVGESYMPVQKCIDGRAVVHLVQEIQNMNYLLEKKI